MASSQSWTDPQLVESYTAKATDRIGNWYEYQLNLPSLLSLIPDGVSKILDFGCGPGDLTAILANKFAGVQGCDQSKAMIAKAKADFPNIKFFVWDGSDKSKPQEDYDTVFAKLTVHFLKDLTAFAATTRQLLKQYGSLVFSVPHPITSQAKVSGSYWEQADYQTEIGNYGIYVTMIHRSLRDLLKPFLTNGFALTAIDEPQVTNEQIVKFGLKKDNPNTPKRLNIRLSRLN